MGASHRDQRQARGNQHGQRNAYQSTPPHISFVARVGPEIRSSRAYRRELLARAVRLFGARLPIGPAQVALESTPQER